MNHAKMLSESFQALAEHAEKVSKYEQAKTQFMAVCADCEGVDFARYSPAILRAASKYILIGFERDMALKYATNYGFDGLYLIDDLQNDFKFNLFKLMEE